jgi:cellulose synthase/poly-beta-1,6-N-acetylglucosamine synthase-like glycosyltransferase
MESAEPDAWWRRMNVIEQSVQSVDGSAALDEPGYGRLIPLLVVGILSVFLCAKVEFRMPHSNTALYAYGVVVTGVVLVQMFFGMIRYRDPAADGIPAGALLPFVTFMVAVHNEEERIEPCVASLVAQTYVRREIIVVDDASTDRTPDILDDVRSRYGVRVVTLSRNVGKKRALGVAMRRARGEIFAFTDSDSIWARDAIERAVRVFVNHPDVGAVSGHCRAVNARKNLLTRIQDSWYEGQFSVRKACESVFGSVSCVSGPLAVFRRAAIYNFVPAWQDDSFLGEEFRFATDRTLTGFVLTSRARSEAIKRAYANSAFLEVDYAWRRWQAVYSKTARSWTAVPESLPRLIRQQVRWKKSFLRNIWFTGAFYWRRPLVPALVYYLHVFFVLAGPFVAFRHLIYLPIHGNVESMVLYLCGIVLIGSMFGLAHRREDPADSGWMYRPLMSLLSTVVLSWLIFYSIATIRRRTWSRG